MNLSTKEHPSGNQHVLLEHPTVYFDDFPIKQIKQNVILSDFPHISPRCSKLETSMASLGISHLPTGPFVGHVPVNVKVMFQSPPTSI